VALQKLQSGINLAIQYAQWANALRLTTKAVDMVPLALNVAAVDSKDTSGGVVLRSAIS